MSTPGSLAPTLEAGLDSDWRFALHEIFARQWVYGLDVVFSHGPLGFLLFPYGKPETAVAFFVGNLILWGSVALLWRRRTQSLPGVTARTTCCVFILVIGAATVRDGIVFASSAALVLSSDARQRGERWSSDLLIGTGMAVLCFVKFTFMLVIVSSMCALALQEIIRHRRVARVPMMWCAALPLVWVWAGQPLSGIPAYLYSTAQLAAGFSEAMGYSYLGWRETVIQVSLASLASMWLILNLRAGFESFRTYCVASISILFCTAMVVKAGFVRHDPEHQMIAATYILFLVVLCVAQLYPPRAAQLGPSVAGLVAVLVLGASFNTPVISPLEISRIFGFVVQTGSDAIAHLTVRVASPEQARRLPPLTTDSYPVGQIIAIRSGAVYSPRPVFQSYAAFNPHLAKLNRDSLISGPPQQVLMSIDPIDSRFPYHEDGVSWPLLWTRYEPTGEWLDDFSVLRLVNHRLPALCQSSLVRRGEGDFFKWTGIESISGWGELRIWVEPSLSGRVIGAVLRPPSLTMEVELDDGTKREYRVLPQLLQEGVLVQPFVSSTSDFIEAGWGNRAALKRITRYRLLPESVPVSAWRRQFRWELHRCSSRAPADSSVSVLSVVEGASVR